MVCRSDGCATGECRGWKAAGRAVVLTSICVLAGLLSCRTTPVIETDRAASSLSGGIVDGGERRIGADTLEVPVLSPSEALETFTLPPGFGIELVASEPLIEDPVAIDFDADGRLWVAEMRAYMPNVEGEGELAPIGRVSVLEDVDGDGRMDQATVFLDSLVLPRAVKALDRGILIAEPPYLWLARDTTGDLRADVREIVRDDYGRRDSNPERNPNGLIWALDNWIISTYYDRRLRVDADARWRTVPTLNRGQWGVGMDDVGRIYRNWNEGPLYVDLLPGHYLARNPNLERTSGVYVDIATDLEVWPARPNVGVNRGYRDAVLREDGRLHRFTAAGSPVAFRGHRLPSDFVNDVFVSEPAGNLVRRYEVGCEEPESIASRHVAIVDDAYADGGCDLRAVNAYAESEFLTSTDERFRPVNFASGPDGTLYVVDMYRGIVQHREYLTEYLEDYILRKDLDRPLGMGRIYRIIHEDFEPELPPRLSTMMPAELVEQLTHPNGWRRDTAQRLLVERGETNAAPALRKLARSAEDPRHRLHALWTLDGLSAVDGETLDAALADASPHVRAAAVRLAETKPDRTARIGPQAGIFRDSNLVVIRQLAASLGALSEPSRSDAIEELLVRHGADSIVVDAALSGLPGLEAAFLERLLQHTDHQHLADAIAMTTAAAMNGGATSIRAYVEDERLAGWQQAAIQNGVDMTSPPPERPDVMPLTEAERERFAVGRDVYAAVCAPCHGMDGTARAAQGAPLDGSPWVNGDTDALIRIVLHGKEGDGLMPPMRQLDDDEIAAVLTFVRRAWSNEASAVAPDEVREVRGRTASRSRPWTEEELLP